MRKHEKQATMEQVIQKPNAAMLILLNYTEGVQVMRLFQQEWPNNSWIQGLQQDSNYYFCMVPTSTTNFNQMTQEIQLRIK